MMERIAEASPRFKARLAGVFYLLNILTGIIAEVLVRGRLVVNSDAAATAHNILAHEPLFRLGFASALICVACYIAVTALFYSLFKADLSVPAARKLSVPLHPGARHPGGRIAVPVAPLDRRERSEVGSENDRLAG